MTLEYAKSLEDERIGEILERLERQLQPSEASSAVAFARELLRWLAPEDLADRPRTSTAPRSRIWRFARERAAGEPSVRVYNPTLEEHGWESPHTVVEIVNDDMPFLVDSVEHGAEPAGGSTHPPDGPPGAARSSATPAGACSSSPAERPAARCRASR